MNPRGDGDAVFLTPWASVTRNRHRVPVDASERCRSPASVLDSGSALGCSQMATLPPRSTPVPMPHSGALRWTDVDSTSCVIDQDYVAFSWGPMNPSSSLDSLRTQRIQELSPGATIEVFETMPHFVVNERLAGTVARSRRKHLRNLRVQLISVDRLRHVAVHPGSRTQRARTRRLGLSTTALFRLKGPVGKAGSSRSPTRFGCQEFGRADRSC